MHIKRWEELLYEILNYESRLLQIQISTFSWTKYLGKITYQ